MALEQAAAYLEETACPTGEYLTLLATNAKDLFALGRPAGTEQTIATTWTVSTRRLRQQTPAAEDLLVLRLLRAAFPDRHTDPDAWPEYAQLLPHALAATGHPNAADADVGDTNWLLTDAGLYLWQRVDPQARALFERVLAICEDRLGADHPDTATSLNNLALVLTGQVDLDRARRLHERALAIHEARLGADHPDTARSLGALANVLRDQGDLDAARPLFERALAIREARLGADHPTTARSLGNLALVLADQGDLDGARTHHERALAIREARLGADHPDTVRSRQDLVAVVAMLDKQR